MERKRVFIHIEDAELAVMLVRLLDRNGVTGFWVTEEAGEKLAQLWGEQEEEPWCVDAWMREIATAWRN